MTYVNEGVESHIITDWNRIVIYSLLLFIGIYISAKSIVNYWREEKEELLYWASAFPDDSVFRWLPNAKSWWTVGRIVFHIFLLAPPARYI